jgi:predicted 2-oxoglutarate/Fe(II)-dependent dioxygenase YbiX
LSTRLQPGEPAPWFIAPTPSNPRYEFHMVAGRFILLAFIPSDPTIRGAMLKGLKGVDHLFDAHNLALFGVLRDADSIAKARDRGALRWVQDAGGDVSRLYGAVGDAGEELGLFVLLDPTLRVFATADWDRADGLWATLNALPKPDDHAGTPITAPVLIVPRVFEPELCRALIDHYDQIGGAPSGVMRQVGGQTLLIQTEYKKRSDVNLSEDSELAKAIRERVRKRLAPEISKAFQFDLTWIERYLVACYDGETGGYFRPHRDNTTSGTAHRKFACSINLNSEEFEGGDLRFPEFGARTYRPPTGGAVIFSCSLMHEATPVTTGRRYAFLPFFYDDAGEKIRRTNVALTLRDPDAVAAAQAAADA